MNLLASESVLYYRTSIELLMPFFFGIILLTFWLLAVRFYKVSFVEALKNFLQTQLIMITFLLSSIINSLANFVNCIQLYNEKFNFKYLNVQCTHNAEYLFWRNVFILPAFLFYALLLPLIALCYLYKNRFNLFELDVVAKIRFLLNGYKQECYYWFSF